jgi:hypothetical protein
MTTTDLTKFHHIPFPKIPPTQMAVYVLKVRFGERLRPIYVGETKTSLRGRMGHYLTASRATAADFVVGTATAMLQELGREVIICYRESGDPPFDERALRRQYIEQGISLLDFFPKYSRLGNCPDVTVKSLRSEEGRGNATNNIRCFIDNLDRESDADARQ